MVISSDTEKVQCGSRLPPFVLFVVVTGFAVCTLFWPYVTFSKNKTDIEYEVFPPFSHPKITNNLTDDILWRQFARDQGMSFVEADLGPGEKYTCSGFFVLWPGSCDVDDLMTEMESISAQMEVMETTVTFYTTAKAGHGGCERVADLPRVEVIYVDKTALLKEYGFESAFPIMAQWPHSKFTRVSDILRLMLAHKYQQSYLDTDVHLLRLQRGVYMREYASAMVYQDSKNSVEIMNSAFCLSRPVLEDMISFVKHRIMDGAAQMFYTELGPAMFRNVLFNRHPVRMYSVNVQSPSLDHIARDVIKYGHMQLHFGGHVQRGSAKLSMLQRANEVRSRVGLPCLSVHPLTSAGVTTRGS